jgi:hypothetical protein
VQLTLSANSFSAASRMRRRLRAASARSGGSLPTTGRSIMGSASGVVTVVFIMLIGP